MTAARDGAETPLPLAAAGSGGFAPAADVFATYRALAEFSSAQYTEPDWRLFPWWRRALYAVSWRPFLALERQFFIKPRQSHEKLLAHLHQSAQTIAQMRRIIEANDERIAWLTARVAALESTREFESMRPHGDRKRTAP